MVQFNFSERTIKAKVVYYGPAQSGKTTNLEQIHRLTDPAAVNLALGPWNSARFGNFLSLDLRAAWEHTWGRGRFQAFLQLYDATGANSTCCRRYSVSGPAGGPYQLILVQAPWLRFTPILGVRWQL